VGLRHRLGEPTGLETVLPRKRKIAGCLYFRLCAGLSAFWFFSLSLAAGQTISLSPTSLSFGVQVVGTVSAFKKITLTNTGMAGLTSIGVTVSPPFVEINSCGTRLSAGAKCTIKISFSPTVVGTSTASLTVTGTAPNRFWCASCEFVTGQP